MHGSPFFSCIYNLMAKRGDIGVNHSHLLNTYERKSNRKLKVKMLLFINLSLSKRLFQAEQITGPTSFFNEVVQDAKEALPKYSRNIQEKMPASKNGKNKSKEQ